MAKTSGVYHHQRAAAGDCFFPSIHHPSPSTNEVSLSLLNARDTFTTKKCQGSEPRRGLPSCSTCSSDIQILLTVKNMYSMYEHDLHSQNDSRIQTHSLSFGKLVFVIVREDRTSSPTIQNLTRLLFLLF